MDSIYLIIFFLNINTMLGTVQDKRNLMITKSDM